MWIFKTKSLFCVFFSWWRHVHFINHFSCTHAIISIVFFYDTVYILNLFSFCSVSAKLYFRFCFGGYKETVCDCLNLGCPRLMRLACSNCPKSQTLLIVFTMCAGLLFCPFTALNWRLQQVHWYLWWKLFSMNVLLLLFLLLLLWL